MTNITTLHPRRTAKQCAEADAIVCALRKEDEAMIRALQRKQEIAKAELNYTAALRTLYLLLGDSVQTDSLRIKADLEARKILRCQT